MKTILTFKTVVIILISSTFSLAQEDSLLSGIPPFAFGNVAPQIASPNNIEASDGISPTRIRVQWDDVVGAKHYIVYRDTHSSGKNMKALLDKNGKTKKYTSPGMYDASKELIAGKLYYYWIGAVETEGEVNLDLQKFDPGYLLATASDDTPNPFEKTDNTTLGNQRSEVKIERVTPKVDTTNQKKRIFSDVELKNNGTATGENIKLFYYLSKDKQLDKDDKRLQIYELESLEASVSYEASLVSVLDGVEAGEYYLIISLQESDLIGNTVVVPIRVVK